MEGQNEERQTFIGGLRIVTEEGLIFQGQLSPGPLALIPIIPGIGNSFITLVLNCPPEILFNGTREDIQPPLYDEGDIVRLNVANIISIGPSGDCLVDALE